MKQTQNFKRTNASIFKIKIENNTKFVCDNLPFDDIKIFKRKRVVNALECLASVEVK
jgi:hypothetical protein